MHKQLKNQFTKALSLLLCFWGLNLRTTPVAAQSITSAPDGTGTVINHNGNTYNIQGGTQAGANLFHSFTEFGLSPDEVANFLSDPQIDNILGRVTGGNASVIQGLIQVSGGNSNLYLMNPNGWVFNQGASLDVPGSFGVTTATRMGFGNGYFNADGANVYSNLTGNPTSLIFDQDNPSWIINEADLAVNSGENLWAVGGGIVSTGTMTGGEITLAALPGKSQVKLDHTGMVLNLVLDAAPAGETNSSVTGIQSVDIPRYLTGGSEESHANYAIVEADGSVRLANRDTVVADGDTVIAGEVNGEEITLMAAGRVKPTDYDLLSNNPVVVLFPEEIGDNVETTFIDEGINDYQGEDAYQAFLYGGKQGTISEVVTHEEGEGINTVTRRLAVIANQGGKVSAIHLLTEGNEGNFWLGRDYVDAENIGEYQEELQQWNAALTAGADILLYSCFTALGVTGEQLITSLAQLTGADVAASTDLTGSEALEGDWVFEKQTGTIETGLGFESQVLADFTGKLQVFTATDAASLIAAITTANGNNEADTINLTGDITLMAVDNNIDGANGLPSILADGGNKLTIDGMGFTIARGATAPNFRLLHIAAGAELEVNNTTLSSGVADGAAFNIVSRGGGILNRGTLTLTNSTVSGNTANDGGGIYNAASLTLNNSIVSNNTANFDGGGIFNIGTVNLSNSTVSNNTTNFDGGGIYNRANAPNTANVNLNNSTVSDNVANDQGAGIYNRGDAANAANVSLNNSTVSGNMANDQGGGIFNDGRNAANAANVSLNNSTVADNTANDDGGGIFNIGNAANAANLTVGNSIIADNNAADLDPDVGINDPGLAPITDNGNNLIGIDTTLQFTPNPPLVGNAMNPIDPRLAPLGDYGGSTQTHALLPDSPAIDAGNNAQATGLTDSRGATRINNTVDIGAFEAQGFALIAVAGDGQSTTVNTNFANDLQIQVVETFANEAIPAAGINITLTPPGTQASTNLGNTTLTTDASGLATTTATANTVAGTYQVAATSTGVTGVNFDLTNNPGAAAILNIDAGNNQNTTVNTAFANSLQVTVTDEFGNAVPNVTVTLTPPATGASANLGSTTLTTDASGLAITTATANTVAGNYQVAVNSIGLTGDNFNLTNNPGAAAILNILTGNNQNTTVNTAFADNLQVEVTDEFGNAVSGVTVTLNSPNTGASANFGSISLTTDASGLASTTATANSIAGNYQVGANVIGVTEVNFDLTNDSAPVTVTNNPTPVTVTNTSTPVTVTNNPTPVTVNNNLTSVTVINDSTANYISELIHIWDSISDELKGSELDKSACLTTPEIVINYTEEEEEEEMNLDEERETEIQRNQDCQPVASEENQ
ncbi:MAG: DUF4347 domain-containing protein [Symploca sp. SIO1C2]|nr:DUF4347 domain-containing protein [Symploca sp. SIO1C2]